MRKLAVGKVETGVPRAVQLFPGRVLSCRIHENNKNWNAVKDFEFRPPFMD